MEQCAATVKKKPRWNWGGNALLIEFDDADI
jgi:hypothetical protein